jgi:hypothetical protein
MQCIMTSSMSYRSSDLIWINRMRNKSNQSNQITTVRAEYGYPKGSPNTNRYAKTSYGACKFERKMYCFVINTV